MGLEALKPSKKSPHYIIAMNFIEFLLENPQLIIEALKRKKRASKGVVLNHG